MSWFTDLRDKVETSLVSSTATGTNAAGATATATANPPASKTGMGSLLSNPLVLLAIVGVVLLIVWKKA